jgi:hypothetical protein
MQVNIKAVNRLVIRSGAALIIVSITLCACAGGNPYPPLIIGTILSAREPKPFPVEGLEPTASIGVVSLLSDELHLRYLPYFEKRDHKDKVASWKINEYVSDFASTSLARRSTFRVGVIKNNEIQRHRVTGRVSDYNSLFDVAEKHQFDAVVIIRPFENAKPRYFGGGYGLLWRKTTFLPGKPGTQCAYSWVIAEVWDVETKDKIGYEQGRTCNRDESIEVKDQLADYPPTEQVWIERLVKRSLIRSVYSAMRDLGL